MRAPWKYFYRCLPWWLKAIIYIIYAWLQLRLRLHVSLYRCIAVSLYRFLVVAKILLGKQGCICDN